MEIWSLSLIFTSDKKHFHKKESCNILILVTAKCPLQKKIIFWMILTIIGLVVNRTTLNIQLKV
jgi:hypothetical protein